MSLWIPPVKQIYPNKVVKKSWKPKNKQKNGISTFSETFMK
jgi:hypothetical protein